MLRRILLALVVLIALPAPASAWGTAAHRYIMRRAIDLLPPELKPFYEHFRDEVVLRTTDPDTWRVVGWDDEDPHHFINFGAREYGAYPFTDLPREYGAAVEKFGKTTLARLGLLPWREQEEFGNLRRAFEEFKRDAPYTSSNVILFTGAASHYIQDATQPFHSSINYDGQLTGQNGLHSRFERDLFERYESRLTITPAAPKAVTNPRDTSFEILMASYQLVDSVLKADKEAIAGSETYDDQYFEKFFTAVRPVLETRLGEAITATAGVIIGAWEQAGKPAVRIRDARPVQKVRRP